MKKKRTWYAVDKSGFHILHTLFQTSLQFPSIRRFDEYFALDLLHADGRCRGVVAMEMRSGRFFPVQRACRDHGQPAAPARFSRSPPTARSRPATGMAMAYRAGVALKDMEFVQYHPTGLPGTGILLTEGLPWRGRHPGQ